MKKQYYIGKTKVKDYIVHENINLVGVLMEDGKNQDYTNEQWVALRSEKPYEDGEISIRKHEKLMQRILKELVDSRVDIGEHSWILENIDNTIGVQYRNAIAKMFNVPHVERVMLAQIDEVLRQDKKKDS